MTDKKQLLCALPKIDECLAGLADRTGSVPPKLVKLAVRHCIDSERQRILTDAPGCQLLSHEQWDERLLEAITLKNQMNLRRVINGTGVVIHTNLGRSLLSATMVDALQQAGTHYTNLEFDLNNGKRGSRYSLVEEIICDLTGAEAALVVNNNAAAVLLALDTLASGKEVIVSRGQLVEIGGSFRIPDVIAKSGAYLVEVGSTNRTHLADYERMINDKTAMLLKVHTSNFRVIGFTSEVSAEELVALAHASGLPVMEDLGSGSFVDLSSFGLPQEPTVQQIVKAGVDVVTFSGDKLLGGPQAGLIVGKKEVIDLIKRNPLNRALRIDKFTLASLEAVLRNYYDLEQALTTIPTLKMLTQPVDLIKRRAKRLMHRVHAKVHPVCSLCLRPTMSRVGGGAMPEHGLPSWAVAFKPLQIHLSAMEQGLRKLPIPIIGKLEDDSLLLDMRTVSDNEIPDLAGSLISFLGRGELP
ncbi:MAG: L-seryl-tRNA(Sec) selenium transferase [Proteobacteria bacterium]|nr:L-seryl-tRNA(Sec) selenium transferase [Pseudomonadota bacterium]MBU4327735.1 L-seryl-tRNA(Sec) selenium transferase [Pseudomonadota bacterium]